MANPLTADQQLAAVKAAGISKIVENSGWRSRGIWRISKGWKPKGIIIHQTAGNLGSRSVQQYADDILNGDPSCPDKCNAFVAPDGTLWMNAAGRANHCLQYSNQALNAMINETFPLTGTVAWRGSLQNMNEHTYGLEMIATAPNAAQVETAARWAAALCRAHGWTAGCIAGHGEVASDRDYSDPGIDMGAFRRRVAAILKSGSPAQEDEDEMKEADWQRMERMIKAQLTYYQTAKDNSPVYKPDKSASWPWRTALWSISYYATHSYNTLCNIARKLGAEVSK